MSEAAEVAASISRFLPPDRKLTLDEARRFVRSMLLGEGEVFIDNVAWELHAERKSS